VTLHADAAVPPAAVAVEPRRSSAVVRLRRMQIDTYRAPVIYMRRACSICRAEGFEAQSRIEIACGARRVIATLNVVGSGRGPGRLDRFAPARHERHRVDACGRCGVPRNGQR
jgi:hypothetical protein